MASSTMNLLKSKGVLGKNEAPVETSTPVDISEFKVKELDAYVQENGIQIDGWSKMKLLQKRAALQEYLDEAAEIDASADAPAAPEEADEAPEVTANGEDFSEDEDYAPSNVPAIADNPLAANDVEVLGPDPVVAANDQIEGLSEDEAHALVPKLLSDSDFAEFKLGGVLRKILKEGWHKGHSTFKEYVQDVQGIHYRKARYLINIYEGLVDKQIPWETVGTVGWTKLKELMPVMDAGNAAEWAKKANAMNAVQLHDYVVEYKKSGAKPDVPEEAETTGKVTTHNVTFKLHEDQKETFDAAMEKAMNFASTDVKTVALDYILTEYLGAPYKTPPIQVTESFFVEAFKKVRGSFEDEGDALQLIFEAFEKVFPDVSIKITVPHGDDADDEAA